MNGSCILSPQYTVHTHTPTHTNTHTTYLAKITLPMCFNCVCRCCRRCRPVVVWMVFLCVWVACTGAGLGVQRTTIFTGGGFVADIARFTFPPLWTQAGTQIGVEFTVVLARQGFAGGAFLSTKMIDTRTPAGICIQIPFVCTRMLRSLHAHWQLLS